MKRWRGYFSELFLIVDSPKYCGNVPPHGHSLSDIAGSERIPAGPQLCSGDDKVVGIDVSGAIVCATDNDTTYLAGSGLFLSSNTFSVDTSYVQARISSSCPVGSSIRVVHADGSVDCETDDDTVYTDAQAVAAVRTADEYVKSTGDAVDGSLSIDGDLNVTGQINGQLVSGIGPAGGRICPLWDTVFQREVHG